jgi:hypothetical protein
LLLFVPGALVLLGTGRLLTLVELQENRGGWLFFVAVVRWLRSGALVLGVRGPGASDAMSAMVMRCRGGGGVPCTYAKWVMVAVVSWGAGGATVPCSCAGCFDANSLEPESEPDISELMPSRPLPRSRFLHQSICVGSMQVSWVSLILDFRLQRTMQPSKRISPSIASDALL